MKGFEKGYTRNEVRRCKKQWKGEGIKDTYWVGGQATVNEECAL